MSPSFHSMGSNNFTFGKVHVGQSSHISNVSQMSQMSDISKVSIDDFGKDDGMVEVNYNDQVDQVDEADVLSQERTEDIHETPRGLNATDDLNGIGSVDTEIESKDKQNSR